MIVRILSSSGSFHGVNYNTEKIDQGLGELMKVAGFGVLQGLTELRPEDYKNELKAISALNKRARNPQFHAAISAPGRSYDKHQLTAIAEDWLRKMGYGDQPYLIIFHRDTANNHVHIVSTRITREGKLIDRGFEHVRAVKNLDKVMGMDEKADLDSAVEKAFTYRFSTLAQFRLLLEQQGYELKEDTGLLQRINDKLATDKPDPKRTAQLKAILLKYSGKYDTAELVNYLKDKHGLVLVFHASAGRPPYGYTLIDHPGKAVYKGSEVLPLKELLGTTSSLDQSVRKEHLATQVQPVIPKLNLQADVDDEAIYGRKRRKRTKK